MASSECVHTGAVCAHSLEAVLRQKRPIPSFKTNVFKRQGTRLEIYEETSWAFFSRLLTVSLIVAPLLFQYARRSRSSLKLIPS